MKSWDGVTARFDANPDYWLQGQPVAKTLSLRIVKDVNTLVTAFKRGETDILNVPLALFNDVFDKDGEVKEDWRGFVYRGVGLNNLKFLAFNMEKSPWGKDQSLRARVVAALDESPDAKAVHGQGASRRFRDSVRRSRF
ncbi:MAG: ABC transporter substrate-binding protein [Methylococcales bacterium]